MPYDVDFSAPYVVFESRRIESPAHEIFEVLRDPKRHREIDGSTMIRDSDAPLIEGVGDAFVMRMSNEEFGDYEMRNEVVAFEADREIAWAPKRHDAVDEEDWNHRWGWQLIPDAEATVVTAYFDCTRVPEQGRRILRDGEWGRPLLIKSLKRLENLVTH